jgi:hypothetical protein
MRLSMGERRRLRGIERSLADPDSPLASLYSIFNRLGRSDIIPADERIGTRARHIRRRKKARDPFWAVSRWLGYPAAAPRGSASDRR